MQAILTQDVKKLGKKYEVVTVKNGYFRNFLSPQNLAVAASPKNLQALSVATEAIRKLRENERKNAESARVSFEGKTIKILAKASDEGSLYASIRPAMIAHAAKEQLQWSLDPEDVKLAKPLSTVGKHAVSVQLDSDITVNISVEVEREGDS